MLSLLQLAKILVRIPRIYTTSELQPSKEVCLDTNACKHIKDVLRLKLGDTIVLFNGDGSDYQCEIKAATKKQITVLVGNKTQVHSESSLNIHLLQPLCRSDKMDWCLQKATELGVGEITPIISKRVNINIPQDRLEKKITHWHAVIASACEQSSRAQIPVIYPPIHLDKAIAAVAKDTVKIVASPSSGETFPTISIAEAKNCVCLVGPEGGLTAEEIMLVENVGFYSVSLGPRILRLETAVLTMITLMQSRWGDLR